jgi:AraC-like DNA-binding protein
MSTGERSDHGSLAVLPRSPRLAPAVPRMIGYRTPPMAGVHRGLPSPYLTLVFSLSGPLPIEIPFGVPRRTGEVAVPVGGLHTRPVLLPPPAVLDGSGCQRGIQLEVHPFAARSLFGVAASELTGEVLELGDLVRGSWEVRERLAEPVDAASAVELVGGWLDRRLRDRPPPAMPAELGRAWQLIVGSGGQCRIGEVAREIGWSRRHLTTRLRAETGLTAKDLARVSRFQRSRRMIGASGHALAGVAADCGYADQSHLCAEWREFADCTPTEWIAAESPAS